MAVQVKRCKEVFLSHNSSEDTDHEISDECQCNTCRFARRMLNNVTIKTHNKQGPRSSESSVTTSPPSDIESTDILQVSERNNTIYKPNKKQVKSKSKIQLNNANNMKEFIRFELRNAQLSYDSRNKGDNEFSSPYKPENKESLMERCQKIIKMLEAQLAREDCFIKSCHAKDAHQQGQSQYGTHCSPTEVAGVDKAVRIEIEIGSRGCCKSPDDLNHPSCRFAEDQKSLDSRQAETFYSCLQYPEKQRADCRYWQCDEKDKNRLAYHLMKGGVYSIVPPRPLSAPPQCCVPKNRCVYDSFDPVYIPGVNQKQWDPSSRWDSYSKRTSLNIGVGEELYPKPICSTCPTFISRTSSCQTNPNQYSSGQPPPCDYSKSELTPCQEYSCPPPCHPSPCQPTPYQGNSGGVRQNFQNQLSPSCHNFQIPQSLSTPPPAFCPPSLTRQLSPYQPSASIQPPCQPSPYRPLPCQGPSSVNQTSSSQSLLQSSSPWQTSSYQQRPCQPTPCQTPPCQPSSRQPLPSSTAPIQHTALSYKPPICMTQTSPCQPAPCQASPCHSPPCQPTPNRSSSNQISCQWSSSTLQCSPTQVSVCQPDPCEAPSCKPQCQQSPCEPSPCKPPPRQLPPWQLPPCQPIFYEPYKWTSRSRQSSPPSCQPSSCQSPPCRPSPCMPVNAPPRCIQVPPCASQNVRYDRRPRALSLGPHDGRNVCQAVTRPCVPRMELGDYERRLAPYAPLSCETSASQLCVSESMATSGSGAASYYHSAVDLTDSWDEDCQSKVNRCLASLDDPETKLNSTSMRSVIVGCQAQKCAESCASGCFNPGNVKNDGFMSGQPSTCVGQCAVRCYATGEKECFTGPKNVCCCKPSIRCLIDESDMEGCAKLFKASLHRLRNLSLLPCYHCREKSHYLATPSCAGNLGKPAPCAKPSIPIRTPPRTIAHAPSKPVVKRKTRLTEARVAQMSPCIKCTHIEKCICSSQPKRNSSIEGDFQKHVSLFKSCLEQIKSMGIHKTESDTTSEESGAWYSITDEVNSTQPTCTCPSRAKLTESTVSRLYKNSSSHESDKIISKLQNAAKSVDDTLRSALPTSKVPSFLKKYTRIPEEAIRSAWDELVERAMESMQGSCQEHNDSTYSDLCSRILRCPTAGSSTILNYSFSKENTPDKSLYCQNQHLNTNYCEAFGPGWDKMKKLFCFNESLEKVSEEKKQIDKTSLHINRIQERLSIITNDDFDITRLRGGSVDNPEKLEKTKNTALKEETVNIYDTFHKKDINLSTSFDKQKEPAPPPAKRSASLPFTENYFRSHSLGRLPSKPAERDDNVCNNKNALE